MRNAWQCFTGGHTHDPRRIRRGALAGASAAVVCLGGLLAACADGGGADDGYVAVGAAAATPQAPPGKGVAPTGDVELVPLDSDETGSPSEGGREPGTSGGAGDDTSGQGDGSATGSASSAGGTGGSGTSASADGDSGAGGDGAGSSRTGGTPSGESPAGASGGSTGGSGGSGTPSTPDASTPSGPAVLDIGDVVREPTDDRWCERVTVAFHNSGGSAVRSGTVTFGTHIIGALGVDWATIESTEKLPAPIDAGETEKKTWTVCVDAWRVPLGMHIETQDVSVEWK
ncbi:hypothetical protein [Streptomyces himalayensis]|uniref:hypothetical protein n=1 Tax=Streptomyces himalayensis TaxID=2820085 RepID=UPI00215D9907|nr:hypothetical protein [Streptomyces himalayensis]